MEFIDCSAHYIGLPAWEVLAQSFHNRIYEAS